MPPQKKKARTEKPVEEAPEDGDDGEEGSSNEASELEVADIEAYARQNLRPGEAVLDEKNRDAEAAEDEVKTNRGVLNKPMILQKVKDLEYKLPEGAKRIPWIDTLAIESDQEVAKGVTSKDGVKLEAQFMQIAGEAVKEAYRRLRVMKQPASRPTDFYAEMFRPDSMMFKVRAWASEETRRINIVEDRKKAKAAKTFQKKAKQKKSEARAGEKRKTMDEIKEWSKKSKQDKRNADDNDLEGILARNNLDKHGRKKKSDKSSKQLAKDKKYGHGGKKSGMKRNTKESFNDMSDSPFVKKKGKGKGKGKGGGKGGSKGKGKGGGKKKR